MAEAREPEEEIVLVRIPAGEDEFLRRGAKIGLQERAGDGTVCVRWPSGREEACAVYPSVGSVLWLQEGSGESTAAPRASSTVFLAS
mmetsp:Transcript_2860/g.11644  ORF Transcript_2860/g.11644 Transcript_2860/m.11644 type:complete len:87 (-) Transcript_2860:229-489(-)